MPGIETSAGVVSRAARFVAAAAVKGAVESPASEDDSSVIDKAKVEEQRASGVRGMREREEEEGEEEEGGVRAENKVYKYKLVARKIRPVSIPELGDEFRVVRRRHPNELANLPELSLRPPNARLTAHITREQLDALKLAEGGFLIKREVRLFEYIVTSYEKVLA